MERLINGSSHPVLSQIVDMVNIVTLRNRYPLVSESSVERDYRLDSNPSGIRMGRPKNMYDLGREWGQITQSNRGQIGQAFPLCSRSLYAGIT